MYINIHTHQPVKGKVMAIQNIYEGFENPPSLFFSAGLHPWHITEEWPNHFTLLEKALTDNHAMAVGECGLDHTCISNWMLQQQAFTQQVMLANKINKPIIVHCVRAYEEVIQMLQKLQNRQPVIFHGFNRNWNIAEKILTAGYYLSFGKALDQQQVQEVFFQSPTDHIFFETDDAAIEIETRYALAATIKSIPLRDLVMQVEMNFEKIFKIPVA